MKTRRPKLPRRPIRRENSSASFTLGIISKLTVVRGQFAAASLLASGVPGPSLMEVHGAAIDLRQVNLNAFTTASLRQPASAPGELAALAGWLNTIVYAADTEGPAVAQGTIKVDASQFGPISVTKLKSKIRLYPKQVFIDDLDLKCYGGSRHGKSFPELRGRESGLQRGRTAQRRQRRSSS